jgi:hypothetical protein
MLQPEEVGAEPVGAEVGGGGHCLLAQAEVVRRVGQAEEAVAVGVSPRTHAAAGRAALRGGAEGGVEHHARRPEGVKLGARHRRPPVQPEVPPQVVAGDEDDDRVDHQLRPAVSRRAWAAQGPDGPARRASPARLYSAASARYSRPAGGVEMIALPCEPTPQPAPRVGGTVTATPAARTVPTPRPPSGAAARGAAEAHHSTVRPAGHRLYKMG